MVSSDGVVLPYKSMLSDKTVLADFMMFSERNILSDGMTRSVGITVDYYCSVPRAVQWNSPYLHLTNKCIEYRGYVNFMPTHTE